MDLFEAYVGVSQLVSKAANQAASYEAVLAVPEITKKYFESLEAPVKRIIMVSEAGHDPNAALIEAQYEVLSEIRQGQASLDRVE